MRTMLAVGLFVVAGCGGDGGRGATDTDTDDTDGGGTDTETDPGAPPPDAFLGLVRGPLLEADPAAAQAYHDGVAAYGQASAEALGDVGHEAFLGTTLLGGSTSAFLAVDEWADAD